MIQANNVSCGYNNINVVKNVSFSVMPNERLCILGPNGCGKTTLLRAVAGLLPYSGSITCGVMEVSSYKRKEIAKSIALMSQTSNLYFQYSVYELVSFGRYARLSDPFGRLSANDREIVLKSINDVGLYEKRNDLIQTLSGGQFQRAFLARAFAQDPDVLLLDEPTNHLDIKCQYDFLEQLDFWSQGKNKIIIAVLHDLNLALQFAQNALLLNNGSQAFYGKMNCLKNDTQLADAFGINVRERMVASLNNWL